MFSAPFDVDHQQVLDEFQLELIELQCSDELKAKYLASNLLDFYKLQLLPSGKFPRLTNHALQVVSMFGTTYRCEQLFSKMKHVKSRLRSQLSDKHLYDQLLLATSDFEPDITHLVSGKQPQVSH